MAQDIVGSLFGIQQQPDYAAQDYRNAIALAEMNRPKQFGRFLGGMIGAPLGRAVAQEVGGLFGAQDPRMAQAAAIKEAQQQGFDVTSPEGLNQLAQFFVQRGQPGLASQVAMQAQTMSRSAAEEQYKLAQAQAALREKEPSPDIVTKRNIYNAFLEQYGGDEAKAAFAFQNWDNNQKRNVAAAGVPAPGMVKLPDLATAKDIVTGYVKPYQDKLTAIGVAGTNLKEAYTNPQAVPQLRQALTTLTGKDNQTSAKELAGILGSMGLAGNVVESINTVLTGKPTKEVLDNAGKAIQALENYYGTQYNAARQQGAGVLSQARLSPETQNVLLPKEYKLPEQKKQSTGKKTISFSDLPQ